MSNPSTTQPRTAPTSLEHAPRPIDIRRPRVVGPDDETTTSGDCHNLGISYSGQPIPTLSSSNPAGQRTDLITPPSPHYLGTDDTAPHTHPGPMTPLRLTTDKAGLSRHGSNRSANARAAAAAALNRQNSYTNLQPLSRTPSLKAAFAHSIGTVSAASSVVASPIISAMGDMTPLPSPLLAGDSPGPWRRLGSAPSSPPQMRERLSSVAESSVLVTSSGESIDAAVAHASKRKVYAALEKSDGGAVAIPHNGQNHTRNRSASEYIPDPSVNKRPVAVSGSHIKLDGQDRNEPHIKRELHLAESRGLTPITAKPPTPPPSEPSGDNRRSSSAEIFEARGRHDQVRRRWRSVRTLGQGTFSRVVLATSQVSETPAESMTQGSDPLDRRSLVAVKICEHGPRGGASEERVEMSLKRELEIMQVIHHPSLVDLKAWDIEPSRAVLVLGYCAGGDLFDVATAQRSTLKASLLRRMFAELMGAVSYLHSQKIVHRDIKLENVLVNLTAEELSDPSMNWSTYPYSVITLTDLGLSRRVADDEQLETRCGSDDYAAPEVIMGQPYDGRATDAWSLGVLLYALLEARLPFDPHPGMSDAHRMRSRTSHRIARVEWRWIEYAGDDGDHDGDEAKFEREGLLGAMYITEGLLKRARSRWSVEKVAKQAWVSEAITVEGGLRFREEQAGEEVS